MSGETFQWIQLLADLIIILLLLVPFGRARVG